MNEKNKESCQKDERAPWIEGAIHDFLRRSPENTLKNQAQDRAFEAAIVGFSRGDDPRYDAYKGHVALSTGHP